MLQNPYNEIFIEEKIPKEWKVEIIVPKFNKGDNNNKRATILSIVLKVYHRILERD